MTKKILIFVIAPAVIAGFFSFLPTIYTEIMKPRAELSYTLVSGPAITGTGGFQRIFGIIVQNTGKVPLTNVGMQPSIKGGHITDMIAENDVLHPNSSLNPPLVTLSRMLPGDKENISARILSDAADTTLELSVRSDEVVGKMIASDQSSQKHGDYIDIIGASLSAVSVAVMSIAFTLFARRGRFSRVFSDRPDIITFIAGISGIVPMTDTILMERHDVSYARMGDIFLLSALSGDEKTKERCIRGLRSLLLIEGIAEDSVFRIRDNLSILGVEYVDEEFKKIRQGAKNANALETRRTIISMFRDLDQHDMAKAA